MGLLTIIRQQKLHDRELRVLVLGLDNSGKTTIIRHLLHNQSPPAPTMGFEISTLSTPTHNINFWDIGGQTSLRPFWGNYFDDTDAVVWVVDAASVERIAESKGELERLIAEQRFIGVRLILAVNKLDLVPPENHLQLLDDIESQLSIDASILLVSGKTGENIPAIVDALVPDVAGFPNRK